MLLFVYPPDSLNTEESTKTAENEIQMKKIVRTAMSLEEANDILRKHEQENNLHYATYFCTKGFGNTGLFIDSFYFMLS